MHTGHVISGAGHLALIGWLLLGDIFASEPPPFEAQSVSMVSGAEFEALLAAQQPPDSTTDVAQPAQPDVEAEVPDVVAEPDDVIEQPAPLQAETPPADPVPEVTEETALPPEPETQDTPPDLSEPVGDQAVLVPDVADEAAPEDVERVAPEPVAQPDPDATPDPVEQEAVTPDAEGEAVEEEPQEATAPDAATTEIVTEATKAPAASARPPGRRPAAPAPQVAATEAPQEEAPDVDAAAIAAAVAAAQTDEGEAEQPPSAPAGPPLTTGERDSLRLAVSQCWNVGSLSSDALNTTVIVSVSMNRDGTPITGSIALEGREGGSEAGARQAYEAARRAIIRCGARGYQLPADKYEQWKEIEITFNPDDMRRR
ncbi:energy transducer TonB [Sulfitobacter sp. JB4-11]|uniref:energy transducer TonB n=1 Tax=Sulfitobacter rhodophyticola TaxID=3238304 RepID=UPI003517376F